MGKGLELVQAVFAQGGFPGGIGRLIGISGVSAEGGRVVLTGSPSEDHYNPLGTVHGGYIATLLDSAIALAVQTVLEPGSKYATTDLKITYLRPLTAASGPVEAVGALISIGRTLILGEAKLCDKDGRLCAHAVGTCLVSSFAGPAAP